MITITQDSELMTNLIPANPIPAGNRFVVFKDDNHDPAVFSLGDDQTLNLVITVNGEPTLTDFGNSSGLFSKGTKIQAFDVKQAPDLGLNICIATEAGNGKSDFHLIYGIKPNELLKPAKADRIVKENGFPETHRIFMSNLYTEKVDSMPLIFLAFKRPDRIVSEEDLGYVNFVKSGDSRYTASLDTSWRLATNPTRIIDVDFGTHKLGDGAFVLYEGVNVTKLQFKVFRGQVSFVAEAQCPTDATCLASFLDSDTGHSILLVGGDKITAFKSSEYVSPKKHGTVIATKDSSMGLKDIHLSTLGDALRVWYTTKADGAHYYTTKISALSEGRLVPLLADGQGGQISGLLSLRPTKGRQDLPVSSLVSVDEHGALLLLQQDPKSGVWQQFPFYHVSNTNVIEVKGYTLRLQAKALSDPGDSDSGLDQALIPGCWLRVSSSGVIRCIMNGRTASLTTTAQWFQTNAQGVLNIVFATKDASCYKVSADAFRPAKTSESSSDVRLLDVPTLDPTRKIVPKLEGINSPQDLRAAKTQTGQLLISNDASNEDVEKGAVAIKLLREQIKKFDNKDEKSFRAFKSNVVSQGQDAVHAVQFSIWDDIAHGFGDAFNWLLDKAKDAWDWVVDTVGEFDPKLAKLTGDSLVSQNSETTWGTFVHLVIKIANETYEIILDSISTIVQAVSWVFKKLGVILQKLIGFLGFLFSWDDILNTTDSMVTMLNAGLDYGDHILTQTDTDVKTWLQSLKKTIKAQLPVLTNYDFEGKGLAGKNRQKTPRIKAAEQEHEESVKAGVGCNWASYQLQYGGATSNATLKDSPTQNSDTDKIKAMWDDIQAEMKTMQTYAVNLIENFVEFFKEGKFDVHTLISKILADTVDVVLDSLTNLSDLLFKAAELGISMVRALCNYEIDVPVFTWLWKWVTKGRVLTLGNFVSFLVAIPSTLLYKAVKGKAPPKLKGRVTKSTFQEYVEKGSVSQDQSLAGDISSFNICATVGVGSILCAVTTITLVVDGVFEGAGLETNSTELQVQKLQVQKLHVQELHVQKLHGQSKEFPVQLFLSLPDWVGNVIDSLSLLLESAALVYGWPLRKHISKQSTEIQLCYWGAWLLEASNVVAIVVTRAIGAYMELPRVVSKRWRGTVAAFTNIPIFLMQLSYHIAEYETSEASTTGSAQTTPAFIRHVLEAIAELSSYWGFAAAAWTDEIENEIMWIGLATYIACTVTEFGLEAVDFALE